MYQCGLTLIKLLVGFVWKEGRITKTIHVTWSVIVAVCSRVCSSILVFFLHIHHADLQLGLWFGGKDLHFPVWNPERYVILTIHCWFWNNTAGEHVKTHMSIFYMQKRFLSISGIKIKLITVAVHEKKFKSHFWWILDWVQSATTLEPQVLQKSHLFTCS